MQLLVEGQAPHEPGRGATNKFLLRFGRIFFIGFLGGIISLTKIYFGETFFIFLESSETNFDLIANRTQ